jgi:hypothetical protein
VLFCSLRAPRCTKPKDCIGPAPSPMFAILKSAAMQKLTVWCLLRCSCHALTPWARIWLLGCVTMQSKPKIESALKHRLVYDARYGRGHRCAPGPSKARRSRGRSGPEFHPVQNFRHNVSHGKADEKARITRDAAGDPAGEGHRAAGEARQRSSRLGRGRAEGDFGLIVSAAKGDQRGRV